MTASLLLATLSVFLVNLPFGYWRASTKKLSFYWFLFIHLPIPLVILLRFLFELGFELYTYPFLIAAFFLGQFIGGKLYRKIHRTESD
jgi:uncharacterized membrane protein AbrB (regulator of aidB expression)